MLPLAKPFYLSHISLALYYWYQLGTYNGIKEDTALKQCVIKNYWGKNKKEFNQTEKKTCRLSIDI